MERLRNQIMAEINRLQAELIVIAINKVGNNTPLFVQETLNLIDGVGEGFVGSDYYAPKRYYSQIPGVKNLRIWRDEVIVKLLDKRGYDLPETIEIRGMTHKITFIESKNFTEEVLD